VELEWVPEIGRWLGGGLLKAWLRDPRVRERWLRHPPPCMAGGSGSDSGTNATATPTKPVQSPAVPIIEPFDDEDFLPESDL
jgi:hypothetical protein